MPKSDHRETSQFYLEMTSTRRVITWIGEPLFKTIWKITLTGREHIPARGPVVAVANHLTLLDMFPMQIALLPRTMFFKAKSNLFFNPGFSAFIRRLGAFPVRRGTVDKWAIEHSNKVLAAGQVLGIFPEGTRSRGGLREGKPGAAQLALKANAPILPMAVTGTEHTFKPGHRRAHVHVAVGAPLYPRPADTAETFIDRVMCALAAMLPPEYRGCYAGKINA